MDELEKLRQKKILEMQKQQETELQEHQRAQEEITNLESLVKEYLTKEALERFGNIKAAHPQKAFQVIGIISQMIQNRQINAINDQQLKKILKTITPKMDFKIRRA